MLHEKRRRGEDVGMVAEEVVEGEEDVDHAFMSTIEDVVLLRNHYISYKRQYIS